jgi:hypothetical protein
VGFKKRITVDIEDFIAVKGFKALGNQQPKKNQAG